MKFLIVLALCGVAPSEPSEVYFKDKFDTLDAWVQSNYNLQALSTEYQGGPQTFPEFATLNGTVIELGDSPEAPTPSIALNRTQATLNCNAGYSNSACKGCETVQSPTRVFTNNIFVCFHPGLEIDGDEVLVPIVPELLQLPEDPITALQPLREFEILLIVCAIIALVQLHTLTVNTEEIDDEVYTYPYQPKTVELSFNKKHEPISLPRISCEYLSKEKCITVPEIKVISETFEKMCENR